MAGAALEMTKKELTDYVAGLEKEMKQAAADLQFERAAMLRDKVFEYRAKLVIGGKMIKDIVVKGAAENNLKI